jgi:L-threonylcarbamoyladenylate synthase
MSEIGQSIPSAVATVQSGGILVYPTEAVFGMGCDYRNQAAVEKLLQLKQRSKNQGLVLIASHVGQILPLIQPMERSHLARALKTWPGHVTWVFPHTKMVPQWISGDFDSVAVRVSTHPAVKALCDRLGHALVSTSANLSGLETADNSQDLRDTWGDQVDYYLDLPLGGESKPSTIKRASDGQQLR